MSDIGTSITVSFLALGVIFLTLSLLIGIIKVLVTWMPYTESLSQARSPVLTGDAETGEHVAIIHSTIAHHLGEPPEKIQIASIKSL